MRKTFALLLALLLCLGLGASQASPLKLPFANVDNPGEKTIIRQYATKGKITIVEVGSNHCGDCRKATPYLESLARKNHDFKFVCLSIDRPGVQGIDFGSPLAKWCHASSIPHYFIFDRDLRIIAESGKTKQNPQPLIIGYLKDNGIPCDRF